MDDCIFCKIVRKEIPAEVIYEDGQTLAFLDIKPVDKGHMLVIPKEHSSNILDTSVQNLTAITATIKHVAVVAMKAVGSSGFNIIVNNGAVAGQVVFHSHWHVIPRFENDGLHMWAEKSYAEGEMAQIAETIRSHI